MMVPRVLGLLASAWLIACTPLGPDEPRVDTAPTPAGDPPRASADPLAEDHVLARWQGGTITAADLDDRVGRDLRSRRVQFLLEQFELQSQALDALVTEALLRDEVERRGLADVDELIREQVEARIEQPTEREIVEFYPTVERQLQGATFDEARPVLVAELVRRAQQQRYAEFLEELRERSDLHVSLPYPELPRVSVPVEPHDPTQGPADAPVTIVQFAEYQCFFCGKVHPTLERIREEYGDKVRIVWKDFPLSNHGRARPAALAAHCAGEQGRYWQMSSRLLSAQQAMTDADIAGHARSIGLDVERFHECVASDLHQAGIQADIELGRSLGVQVTPTFFINGVLLSGAQSYDRFASLIDRELTR